MLFKKDHQIIIDKIFKIVNFLLKLFFTKFSFLLIILLKMLMTVQILLKIINFE